jgi:hypothetical protein
MQAKDAPNPVAAPSGWARVRVNVKKDKTSKASSRQLTGHAMTMRRNLLHKDPLPEEASEAYTMLIDATTSNLGHAHRQRKEAKGVLCKALWMSQNKAVSSICRVHVSSICRVHVSSICRVHVSSICRVHVSSICRVHVSSICRVHVSSICRVHVSSICRVHVSSICRVHVSSICRVHVSSICRVQVSYTLYNFKNLVAQQLRKYTRHSPWQAARVTCAEQQHTCARSQHKKEQRGALWYMQTEGITRRS